MSKGKKLLIGFLTIWPFIYVLLVIAGAAGFVFFVAGDPSVLDGDRPPTSFILGAGTLLIFHFLTILTAIGMLIFYIIHALKNTSIPQDNKVWWVVGMVFCGGIVNIVYYFMFIWKLPEPATSF